MTAALVTARLKSTRLPRKALKPLGGKPLIVHLLDRLKTARLLERIVICTSTVREDDPLEELASEQGVECYRGDPDDVLMRLACAAEAFGSPDVINCSADNPFVEPTYVDRLLTFHRRGDYDYSRVEGLPFGAFSYALSTPALHRACELKATEHTEVWGGYFTQTGIFRVGTLQVEDPELRWPELRLTVDTPEDFALARWVVESLDRPDRVFGVREIIRLCRDRPELLRINAHVRQKRPAPIQLKKSGRLDGSEALA